jgi:hypothetical protein
MEIHLHLHISANLENNPPEKQWVLYATQNISTVFATRQAGTERKKVFHFQWKFALIGIYKFN